MYSDREMILDALQFCLSFILSFVGQLIIAIILIYFIFIFIFFFILIQIIKFLARLFLFIVPIPIHWRFVFQRKIVRIKNKIKNVDLVPVALIIILMFVAIIGLGFRSLAKTKLPDFQRWASTKIQIVDSDKDGLIDFVVINLSSKRDKMNGKLILDLKTNHSIFIWQKKNKKPHFAIKKPFSEKWVIDDNKYLEKFLMNFNN